MEEKIIKLPEQIEKGRFINPHNSRYKKYLKKRLHRAWRKFNKTLNDLKPKYNRYKGWEG